MHFRIALGSLLLLGATAAAQVSPLLPQPTPVVPVTPPATQDPDRPEPTPAEQITELAKQKQRLEQEILYVRSRAENAKAMLTTKLGKRQQAFRSIDAGAIITAMPKVAPAPRRFAQVATDEQLANHTGDTLVLVNNRPITQARFDQLMNYLRSVPSSGDDAMQSQRALFELIRVEAVASTFEESEGEAQLAEAMSQLQQGKPMADVAKAFGVLAGSQPDGKIQVTRNSQFGSVLELIAFSTPVGEQARPFRNAQGYVLVRVDSIEKGASTELDKAHCSAVQVYYTADQEVLQKAQFAVNAGQVDIVVRDQSVLALLPQMFKAPPATAEAQPTPAGPAAAGTAALLTRKLEQLQAEIVRLQGSQEAGAAVRVKDLENQYREAKAALRQALNGAKDEGAPKDDGKGDDAAQAKPAPATKKG